MLRGQKKADRELSAGKYEQVERNYLRKRIRRRTQVAGMILLIGIMIPIGDAFIPWQNALATFAVYWIIVLILAFWTILLAFADIAATKTHSSVELSRLERQKKELEHMAQQIRDMQQASQDS